MRPRYFWPEMSVWLWRDGLGMLRFEPGTADGTMRTLLGTLVPPSLTERAEQKYLELSLGAANE